MLRFITALFRSYRQTCKLAAAIIGVAGVGFIVSSTHNPLLGIIALCFVACGNLACQPVFWTLPSRFLTGVAAASGIAFINSMGNLGGFVAPNLRVWAEQAFNNPSAGLYAMAFSGFIAAGLLLLSIPFGIGQNLKNKLPEKEKSGLADTSSNH